MTFLDGIKVKKQFGQHFLRDQSVIDQMISSVAIGNTTSVFEIGCGDGFLTKSILTQDIARLWVFEIDQEWADYVQKHYGNLRLQIFKENILDVDFERFQESKPWILLANLPYQITFPILYLLQKNIHLLKEGVIMVQEEVAQKITAKSGRGYGFPAVFFQHFFDWKLLKKIPPIAFVPPPKVDSRLLYFMPKQNPDSIPEIDKFWKFIKIIFKQPRRTMRNNLAQSDYDASKLTEKELMLRAQQLSKQELINIWNKLRITS